MPAPPTKLPGFLKYATKPPTGRSQNLWQQEKTLVAQTLLVYPEWVEGSAVVPSTRPAGIAPAPGTSQTPCPAAAATVAGFWLTAIPKIFMLHNSNSSGCFMKRKTIRRIAKLKPEEDNAWVFTFCFYKDKGFSDLRADAATWQDLRLEFPRLRRYDGCA